MIDFNFSAELLINRFTQPINRYPIPSNSLMVNTSLLLLNPKMIPIIKMQGRELTAKLPAEDLLCSNGVSFNAKALNKAKIAEVVQTAPYLMNITVTSLQFVVGKGFIGIVNPGQDMKPLMVVVVTDVQTTNPDDMSLLVDVSFKDQPVIIRGVIQDMITDFTGDIIYTGHIDKHLSGKIKLPSFSNIRAKKEFTETFIDQCIAAL